MTPPNRPYSRPERGVLRFGVPACVLGLILVVPGIASAADADEGASVDDVTMQVVEDPEADERDYVQDIEPPGIDRASDERSQGSSAGEGHEAAGDRPAEAGGEAAGEARDAADSAREGAQDAREGAQDARDAGPPEDAEAPADAGPPDSG